MADYGIKMEADGEGSPQICLNVESFNENYIYPTVTFTTEEASVGYYQLFMRSIRNNLQSGATSHGIPIMRKPSEITNQNMFVLVQLINHKSKLSITLALTVLNAYVIGLKSEGNAFFFTDAPAVSERLLFDGTTKARLPVKTSNYSDLKDRSKVPLGIEHLQNAIDFLHNSDGTVIQDEYRQSLVVVIEMVSEATRFRFIQKYIEGNLITGFTPKGDTISYENKWDSLSEQIQKSGPDGEFKTRVQVQNADYTPKYITNVAQVEDDIAILLYKATGKTLGGGEIGDDGAENVVEE